ncbi:MAG: hypothetical protein OEX03_12635 [Gammaproteobacteria bacterium]|nr:hypothetical protein [Gammaproteobacteria bacterium]MDH5361411.1 hypothetical protein [Gammaproteobacteria bacterium]
MKVGGNPGIQAAQQLMQSTNQVGRMAVQQVTMANEKIESSKDSALQNTVQQVASSVGRKGTVIDTMA